MSKKVVNENPEVFAYSTLTHLLSKYAPDAEGNIDYSFNIRTYIKKAYKAYLKGKSVFRYKNKIHVVPKISKNKKEEILDSMILEEENNIL
jgi:hypothetical protein